MKLQTAKLTEKENAFLESLVPWSWYLQEQTRVKALTYKNFAGAYGFNSVLFTAYVLSVTNWGSHPISQEKFKGKDACNLLLLPATELWEGRVVKFDGVDYKLFDSYEEFCIDYSDHLVFSGEYDLLLLEKDYLKQLDLLTRDDSRCYTSIVKVLSMLGLKSGSK